LVALHQISLMRILPALFGVILIPRAVAQEAISVNLERDSGRLGEFIEEGDAGVSQSDFAGPTLVWDVRNHPDRGRLARPRARPR
jgi:hypothetical protein